MKQPSELLIRTHYVNNHDGWELELRQCYHPHRLQENLRPLMIVPGYGMNAFIFGYHPNGVSMEAAWANQGFDVWSVNLRAQGASRRKGPKKSYTMADIAKHDIPAALRGILKHTVAKGATRVDGVGCSLGGTFLYSYLALENDSQLGSLVAMGAPLRWDEINPILKVAFSIPDLLGMIPMRGTQRMARALFPLAAKFPFLLQAYLHPEIVDISAGAELTRTVEDPNPRLNRQIGYWIRHKDLILDGVNITQALAGKTNPLLCVVANGDGIVPEATALSGSRAMGSPVKDTLTIGDHVQAYAHADLFISNHADKKIFIPIAEWLMHQQKSNVRAY